MTGWRSIGVIGGMGPAATADFLNRLVAGAGAARDGDHPRVFVDSNPHVPDRNAARRGEGPSPGPVLAAMAKGLAAMGAEVLAMPCNAAHGWAGEIVEASPAVFVDMVDAAVKAALRFAPATVGILAVAATLDAGLYRRRLEAAGIAVIDCDRAVVQPLVSRIKGGDIGVEVRSGLVAEAARLVAAGADVIIAACSELPLALSRLDASTPLVDATAALVSATLAAARR